MTVLTFLIFNLTLLLFARGLLLILRSLFKHHKVIISKFLEEETIYFPIISLFILGNFAFVINFIYPLKASFPLLLSIVLLIVLYNLTSINFYNINYEGLVTHLLIPAILSFSSYGSSFHVDAAAYHLNAQNWIRESQVVFGLSNITWTYGYQSMFEFISASFWLKNNFIFLHFVNVVFMTLFFNFLYKNLLKSDSTFLFFFSLTTLLFGLLDNFGVDGGKNGFVVFQSIGKFDVSFGILFLITNLKIINEIKSKKYSSTEFHLIMFLSLFSFQIKVFGIYLLIPLLFYLTYFKISILKFINKTFTYIGLLLLWLIKSIINTACAIYPISITCIDSLDWYIDGWVTYLVKDVRSFHKSYNFDENLIDWFIEWRMFGQNNTTVINFAFSIFIIFLITIIFTKKSRFFSRQNMLIASYIFLLNLLWLYSSPEIRFGIGIFLLSLSILSMSIYEFKYKFIKKIANKHSFTLLVLVCSFLVVRLESYQYFIDNPSKFYEIDVPIIEYISNPSTWNVIPADNINECWINLECVPAKWIMYKDSRGSYTLITNEFITYP